MYIVRGLKNPPAQRAVDASMELPSAAFLHSVISKMIKGVVGFENGKVRRR